MEDLNTPQNDSNSLQDYQELSSKLTKLFRIQSDALNPPSFTLPICEQFSTLLIQIKTQASHAISQKPADYVKIILPYIPQIVELTQNNFYHNTIRNFQLDVSKLIPLCNEIISKPNPNINKSTISSNLQNLMPKVFQANYTKVSLTVWSSIQQLLKSLQTEFSQKNSAGGVEQISEKIEQILASLQHISAVHQFLLTVESLEKTFRQITSKDSSIVEIHNSDHILHPTKPRINEIREESETIPASTILDNFIQATTENMDGVDENQLRETFVKDFQNAISSELRMESCTNVVDHLLKLFVEFDPLIDVKSRLFQPLQYFYIYVSRSLSELYKLPTTVTSKSDILPFVQSIENVKDAFDQLMKVKKGAALPPDSKNILSANLQPLLNLERVLQTIVDLVEKANKETNKLSETRAELFTINLKPLLPASVDFRFVISDDKFIQEHTKLRRFNIIRALATIHKKLQELEDSAEIRMRDPESVDILHPPDFSAIFQKIREDYLSLETDLFKLSYEKYNDFLLIKSGTTILSIFTDLEVGLEPSLLQMQSIPISTASFRELSFILFDQSFFVETEPIFMNIMANYVKIFEVYEIFEQLQVSGAADLSICAQLSFLLTISKKLADHFPPIIDFYQYFKQINIFEINSNELLDKVHRLKNVISQHLSQWTCNEYVEQISSHIILLKSSISEIKNEPLPPSVLKIISDYISWIESLTKTPPKHKEVRELYIRIMIMKKTFQEYIQQNPENSTIFQEVLKSFDYFSQLLEHFNSKTLMKTTLSFLCRVNFNSEILSESIDEEPVTSESETVQEDSSRYYLFNQMNQEKEDEEQSSEESQNSDAESQSIDVDKPIQYTSKTHEKCSAFLEKAQTHVNSSNLHESLPRSIINLLSNTKRSFEVFKEEWKSEDFIQSDIRLISHIFQNPTPKEERIMNSDFDTKIISYFSRSVTKLIDILSNFKQGHQRSSRSFSSNKNNPIANKLPKIITQLKTIRNDINKDNLSWIFDLYKEYSSIYTTFKTLSISPDQISPKLYMRKLVYLLYTYFKFNRSLCIKLKLANKSKGENEKILFDQNTFSYDLELLSVLISILMENEQYISNSHPILFNELVNAIEGQNSFLLSDFMPSYKLLRKSKAIIDIKEIVYDNNLPFFNWEELLSRLPPGSSSLSSFIDSEFYQILEDRSYLLVPRFVENCDSNFIIDDFKQMLAFKSSLSYCPITINWNYLEDSVDRISDLQLLFDLSKNFDEITHILQNNDSNSVSGTQLLSIQILLYQLQREIEIIIRANTESLLSLFTPFSKVIKTLEQINSSFGPIPKESIQPLVHEYESFLSSLDLSIVSQFYKEYKHDAFIIMNAMNDSEQNEFLHEIKSVSYLTGIFDANHERTNLQKLIFAFLYVSKQQNRFFINPASNLGFTTSYLPFYKIQNELQAILSVYSIIDIIPHINKYFTDLFNVELPTVNLNIDQYFKINDIDEKELSENIEPKSEHFKEQISMFDQTALSQLTASVFDTSVQLEEIAMENEFKNRLISNQIKKFDKYERNARQFGKINSDIQQYINSNQEKQNQTPRPDLQLEKELAKQANAKQVHSSMLYGQGCHSFQNATILHSLLQQTNLTHHANYEQHKLQVECQERSQFVQRASAMLDCMKNCQNEWNETINKKNINPK